MSSVETSPMITISNGLLDPKHIAAMGPALAEFLCLIDWQTDASGVVRGGAPVNIAAIAERLGRSRRTVQRNLKRLDEYLDVRRTPRGLVIRIRNPKKWFRRGKSGYPDSRSGGDISVTSRGVKNGASPTLWGDKSGTTGVTNVSHPINTNTERRIQRGRSGAKNAPPPFVCSHQDCSNQTYHAGRMVAESQGLEFPGDVGNLARWLRDSKDLTKYADSDLVEFVAHKVRKDSPKWDDQKLRPNFVAEDIGAYLRKRSASAANTEPNGLAGFWMSDREKDRRREAAEGGHA